MDTKHDLFKSSIQNNDPEFPNLFIMMHGNLPSRYSEYHFEPQQKKKARITDYEDFSFRIPDGFILLYFTPENTQFWGSKDTVQNDMKLFTSTLIPWYLKKNKLVDLAQIYFSGDEFINLALNFDKEEFMEIYSLYKDPVVWSKYDKLHVKMLGQQLGLPQKQSDVEEEQSSLPDFQPYSKLNSGSIEFESFPDDDEPYNNIVTLKWLFDKLKSKREPTTPDNGTRPTQIVYLFACNPFPILIDDFDEIIGKKGNYWKDKLDEYKTISVKRTVIMNEGRKRFAEINNYSPGVADETPYERKLNIKTSIPIEDAGMDPALQPYITKSLPDSFYQEPSDQLMPPLPDGYREKTIQRERQHQLLLNFDQSKTPIKIALSKQKSKSIPSIKVTNAQGSKKTQKINTKNTLQLMEARPPKPPNKGGNKKRRKTRKKRRKTRRRVRKRNKKTRK